MKYVFIGKETVEGISDVHDLFAEAFDFPEYYGRNFDALFDCLTEMSDPVLIVIADNEYFAEKLGELYFILNNVLESAAADNKNISIRFVN